MWSIIPWDGRESMLSFDFRGHMSSESQEVNLTSAQTECFIRKLTHSVSRVPGNGAVEDFCLSVSAVVSGIKNAGVYDAKPQLYSIQCNR